MKVGDEVEHTCPRCKLLLAHIILYFLRDGRIGGVQCRTCGSQHRYRSHRAARIRRPLPSSRTIKRLVEGGSFEERLSLLDRSRLVPYRMDGRFARDDAIRHPKFGVGFVLRSTPERIEVLFEEGIKMLVHKG